MKSALYRNLVIGGLVLGIVVLSLAVYANNVSRVRHPNLAAAQTFIEKAINKVSAAQVANEFDMNGHAAKAKSLLDEAYTEIKFAAQAANINK